MQTTRFIYLAGPILNCTKGEANDWRKLVDTAFEHATGNGIRGISPLRCEPLIGDKYTMNYPDPKFGTARAIGAKNLTDVQMCDLTFAYMPKPVEGKVHSVGTILEIGYAKALGKPIVLVSDDDFLHGHPVMTTFTGWTLRTLEEGIEVVVGLLDGYTGGKNV